MAKKEQKETRTPETMAITIKPANFQVRRFTIYGTTPLLQAAWSKKARDKLKANMTAGGAAKSKKTREPRDFEADFRGAMHISEQGWYGVPASSFRNACIEVCRMVGFKMTHAKMSIFVEADGLDVVDGTPLVKLQVGEPERNEQCVRNATGVVDIRVRPMWRKWAIELRIRWDADQFTQDDVANLLERAGQQCGIGEGRPFSKQSNGLGLGTFSLTNPDAMRGVAAE